MDIPNPIPRCTIFFATSSFGRAAGRGVRGGWPGGWPASRRAEPDVPIYQKSQSLLMSFLQIKVRPNRNLSAKFSRLWMCKLRSLDLEIKICLTAVWVYVKIINWFCFSVVGRIRSTSTRLRPHTNFVKK